MHRWLTVVLLSAATGFASEVPRNDGTSWPTLHGDLCRSGFYPVFPEGKLSLAWRKELYRELTGPRAEVIVGGGLAFMGTYAGNLYAWDAATGEQRWVFKTGRPIGHSPTYADGTVFVGSMDRRLRAIDAASGKEKWNFEASEGIWMSPAVHDGLVFFGDRAGVLYALAAASGAQRWKFQTGDRIVNSPALSADGELILFVSEDMHTYCLRVRDGDLKWKSRKLSGLSARDYFPVVANGLALVTTNPVKDFHAILGEADRMLVERTGFAGEDKRYIPGDAADVEREQDAIVAHLRAHPDEQVFFAFDVRDGHERWIAPVLYTGGLHNPFAPPCVDLESGKIYTLVRSAYGTWDGGGEVRSFTAPGELDPETGRIRLLEHSYLSKDPARPPGQKDMPWMTFNMIGDETQVLSCAPSRLFSNHQGYLGMLDLRTGKMANRFGKRDTYGGFYGPGNFGWENEGGREKAATAGDPFGIINEWHGPARAIISVAKGRVYFTTGSQVLCLEVEK